MAILTVPIIDIAPYWGGTAARKREMAQQVDEACRDIGFLIIAGHGVSPDLIAAVDEVSREFFDLPLEEKMRVARPAPDVTRGYIPMEGESVARSRGEYAPGDLNESMMIGPVDRPTVSPLIIPLLYCHINGFQRAFSVEKPLPGGEKRMAGWAAHPVEW